MHQIVPFLKKIRTPPLPLSTSVIPHFYRATCELSLVNSLIFIKTLKNADQILKILCTDAFTFFKIFKFKLLEQRKSPFSPLPEKQMVCPLFKTNNLESTPPYLLYQVQQYHLRKTSYFELYIMYMYFIKIIICHVLVYSFIVFKYVILILRREKDILGRIGLYFWGVETKLD